jgi:hypothetical protein
LTIGTKVTLPATILRSPLSSSAMTRRIASVPQISLPWVAPMMITLGPSSSPV